jgi:hypothetical protein
MLYILLSPAKYVIALSHLTHDYLPICHGARTPSPRVRTSTLLSPNEWGLLLSPQASVWAYALAALSSSHRRGHSQGSCCCG